MPRTRASSRGPGAQRIAREIHDGLGHYLTVVHVQLEAAQATLRTQPEQAERALENAAALARDGLARCARRWPVLRGPLLPASLARAGEARRKPSIRRRPRDRHHRGHPAQARRAGGARLYRAAQEALTNTSKHGRAKHVQIALIYAATAKCASGGDDGAGAEQPKDGFGLLGFARAPPRSWAARCTSARRLVRASPSKSC